MTQTNRQQAKVVLRQTLLGPVYICVEGQAAVTLVTLLWLLIISWSQQATQNRARMKNFFYQFDIVQKLSGKNAEFIIYAKLFPKCWVYN